MPRVIGRFRSLVLGAVSAGLFLSFLSTVSRADNDPAVLKGLEYLRRSAGGAQTGESALIALAMLKADVPPEDPALAKCINKLQSRFTGGGYSPERSGGTEVYEAGVVAMALSNYDHSNRKDELTAIARYLTSQQKANGSWDYTQRTAGDTSISQYAVLGLWEAENGGASVAPEVWERAATWYMSSQSSAGSWNYHRDESKPETVSMTAAGVGSLLICQRQLSHYRRGADAMSSLLTPVTSDGVTLKYDVTISTARMEQAIRRGLGWLASNFNPGDPVMGQSAFYGLYGIERAGSLSGRDAMGRVAWYDLGRRYILSTQQGDGSWNSDFGPVPNTVWAILFITRATAKTLAKIQIRALGAGTLLGGRGLPKDLSSLTVAGGRVVSRPMNGAVEGMIAALEDPRGEQANSALAGLVTRYQTEGPAVFKPHKERLRKLLNDRDQGLRKIAAWALARTGDVDVIAALIGAITDPDEEVVTIARQGLQLISRKITGPGPTSPSTPEQRVEAAQRWRAWFASIRPLDLESPADDTSAPADARRTP